MQVLTAAVVRDMDAAAIAAGTSGLTLMERAGQGLTQQLRRLLVGPWRECVRQVVVIAGRGNNGGDGFVMARLLAADWPVTVCLPCLPTAFSGDARVNLDRLPHTVRLRFVDDLPAELLSADTVVIDAMLGTGASGPPRAPFDRWIRQINDSRAQVVAVDIPSGLDADTGKADLAIRAVCTLTIAAPKPGLFLADGPVHAGIIRYVDIGLQPPAGTVGPFASLVDDELTARLPRLAPDRHKGDMGRILVVGGSAAYRGAPVLAAAGAARAGAGLVSILMPQQVAVPPAPCALMFRAVPEAGELVHQAMPEPVVAALAAAADVLVLGPGLGRHAASLALMRQFIACGRPQIIDADGLQAITADCLPLATAVLTPHPGEFRSLAERLQLTLTGDRLVDATAMARRTGAVIVLKGLRTVVAGPEGQSYVCGRGCAALATGGSGDVLAGVIAAWLARMPADPALAAAVAVHLHAAASEFHPNGEAGFIADDLPLAIARMHGGR